MLLGLVAAAFQPELPAPPAPPAPPPLVRTNVPPPVISVPSLAPLPPRAVATFRVKVSLGSEQLVDERLRVGLVHATINRSRQEALGGNCPTVAASLSQSLSVTLRPDYGAATSPDRWRMDLRLSRPVQQGCDSGSRGVTLEQQFTLGPGQSLSLTGDGGLKVELRRE